MKRKIAPNNGGGATNLNKEALASLDAAVNEPSDASFTKAIRLHQLIDQDAMGVDLWHRAVKEKVAGPECARAALPAPRGQPSQPPPALAMTARVRLCVP